MLKMYYVCKIMLLISPSLSLSSAISLSDQATIRLNTFYADNHLWGELIWISQLSASIFRALLF